MLKETAIITNTLKELGEPTKLQDIVELTNHEIPWGANPTHFMNNILKETTNVKREKKGYYQYVNLEEYKEDKKLKEITPHIEYNIGDIFIGRVTGIESYGVFVEDESHNSGLIHYTSVIKGESVHFLHKHFRLGDKVEAKVIKKKEYKKYSLSTFHLSLPNYDEIPASTEQKVTQNDLYHLIKHLQEIVGVVSEPANEKLVMLIEEEGIVPFMIALSEIGKEFKVDVGLQLINQVEHKMRERL